MLMSLVSSVLRRGREVRQIRPAQRQGGPTLLAPLGRGAAGLGARMWALRLIQAQARWWEYPISRYVPLPREYNLNPA